MTEAQGKSTIMLISERKERVGRRYLRQKNVIELEELGGHRKGHGVVG